MNCQGIKQLAIAACAYAGAYHNHQIATTDLLLMLAKTLPHQALIRLRLTALPAFRIDTAIPNRGYCNELETARTEIKRSPDLYLHCRNTR